MNFTKGIKGSKELRGKLLSVKNIDGIKKLIEEFHSNL